MKLKSIIAITALSFGLAITTHAQDKKAETKPAAKADVKKDDHADHDHGMKAGPSGGRLITEVEPHVEFFVNKDKKVEIRFVDDDNKVVAPAAQIITATLGDRSKPTKLIFTKDGDKLVSDKAVPEGNDYPTVVQIKTDAKAKAVNAKFNLNMSKCPTCENAEYACTCDHGAEEKAEKKDAKKTK